jgi:hypothetical protein
MAAHPQVWVVVFEPAGRGADAAHLGLPFTHKKAGTKNLSVNRHGLSPANQGCG